VSGKEVLIGRIMRSQEELAHVFALDRSNPLLSANLTMPQLKVLLVLAVRGPQSSADLTHVMGVTPATMTGIVDRLAANGLVSRRTDANDRRVRRIELTGQGSKLIDGIVVAGAERQRRMLHRLTIAELETVAKAAELVLTAARDDAASRGADGQVTVDA
jgi:DNA-binding MarR family transcriptional regulator